MTELSTEPVVIEAAPTAPPPPTELPKTTAKDVKEADHTPGGWPIVPLALSGTNTTVGLVAAASLAGGPIAAIVAATGAVVLGTVAATRSHTPNKRRDTRRSAARNAGRAAARSAGQHRGGASRTGAGGRTHGSRSGRTGGAGSGRLPGRHRRGTDTTARHGSTAGQTPSKSGHGAHWNSAGRVGQVRALRGAQQDAAGSRAGQRAQTIAARRAVADARRNAARYSTGLTSRAGRKDGIAGRMVGGAARKARAARDAAITKNRARRDGKSGATIDAQRGNVRKAPARKAARQALRRSAARFHRRRLIAALLALPLGLLGFLTSPIGRKFRLPWLIQPGRRLYRRIVGTAREQRALRDDAIRDDLSEREAAVDAEAATDGSPGIADAVQRPAHQVPSSTNVPVSEGENVSGFRFEEAASEMEQAANQYEPENAMEILAMVEGLPAALTCVANVMKILAERSDSEFPLEKEIADGFSDIFGALMSAVAVSEDMGQLFRQVHAQDIARHEDPRNGPDAEKGWNV
ncbi:hypothetical protein ABT040_18340 [Streptomyces sp. NPDC002688]|uniref:hypothetical protein n=1 Tax=Streptomyces sp. NPDC002688 TaxID=3154423 RepID=UPI003332C5B2